MKKRDPERIPGRFFRIPYLTKDKFYISVQKLYIRTELKNGQVVETTCVY